MSKDIANSDIDSKLENLINLILESKNLSDEEKISIFKKALRMIEEYKKEEII